MELVRTQVLPYQWDALNDKVPGAAPSFCMRNYKLAGKITKARKELGDQYQEKIFPTNIFETLPKDMEHLEERFYGFVFQDSDFSKWVEAVAYSLTQHPDSNLEQIADDAIDIVCAAQQENGYLDTYYIINDMSKIFTDLQNYHELYCFGHLAEGAVAYYQATGKDKLLHAAQKYADYIASCFGAKEGKKRGYPGHEIAEMALVRLYEVTQEQKYLDLCTFFLNERGKKPYYFDLEQKKVLKPGEEDQLRYTYHQAHLPVREQQEAAGHAVRAVYLYSGMADAARLTGDARLLAACENLWDSVTTQKMYITGGIGGTHVGEAFSFPYDLPNDTAYAETCASIGLVFFARRMLQIKADSKYANVMERALYNGVLSGMALDGKSFFYVNPLEVLPEACHKDERKFHVKPVRQKWFGCACCPPNLARLVSSIASYAYTVGTDILYMHLYMGGTIHTTLAGQEVSFTVDTGLPWRGSVSVTADAEITADITLAIRIPDWCDSYRINGAQNQPDAAKIQSGEFKASCSMKDGYLYLTKSWAAGEALLLDFSMPIRLMQANGRVKEDAGCVAVTRGPIVYCMEEADNGSQLWLLEVHAGKTGHVQQKVLCKAGGEDYVTTAVTMSGRRRTDPSGHGELYCEFSAPSYEDVELTYIPYFTWANRGEGEMQVWTRYYFPSLPPQV